MSVGHKLEASHVLLRAEHRRALGTHEFQGAAQAVLGDLARMAGRTAHVLVVDQMIEKVDPVWDEAADPPPGVASHHHVIPEVSDLVRALPSEQRL